MEKSNLVYDTDRTSIALAFTNPGGIADLVLPIIPVKKKLFSYNLMDKERSAQRLIDTEVSTKGKPKKVSFGMTVETANTKGHALTDDVAQEDIDEALEDFDPLDQATEGVTELLLLSREKRVADLVKDEANYGGNVQTFAAKLKTTAGKALSLPEIICEHLDDCLIRPNQLTLDRKTATALLTHPSILKGFHGNSGDTGKASFQYLKDLLEIENIFVGMAWGNLAKVGKAEEMVRIWQNTMAFQHINSTANPSMNDGRLTWGFQAESMAYETSIGFDGAPGVKGVHTVKVAGMSTEKVVVPQAGLMFKGML